MDEIIFKDSKGKIKMSLKGDVLDIKDLEKDADILDKMIATLTKKKNKKEEENESSED